MSVIICTPRCWTPVYCKVCGRPFSQVGHSVPIEAATGYCDPYEPCDPQQREQRFRHLWDEHDDTRIHADPEGWREHVAACEKCGADR